MMDHAEVAAEYEQGCTWIGWKDADPRRVLQMRLDALEYRRTICENEIEQLRQEESVLNDLLMAI
jgi:hypothetical protein